MSKLFNLALTVICLYSFSLPILSSYIFLKAQQRGRKLNVKRCAFKETYVTLKIQKLIHNKQVILFQQKMPDWWYFCLGNGLNPSKRHYSHSLPAEMEE